MRKINKIIKATLLLSTLNLCGQFSSLGMEPIHDDMDVERNKSLQGQLLDTSEDESILYYPGEMYGCLLSYLDLSRDVNTRLSFMTACRYTLLLGMRDYEKANQKNKHYSVHNFEDVYESTVFIIHTRLLNILGLYSNIKLSMCNEIDQIRFSNLCNQFMNCPFLTNSSELVNYVSFLQYDVNDDFPAPLEAQELDFLKQTCFNNLFFITEQHPYIQTERALYLHFCQFVNDLPFEQLGIPQALDCSLMRVLNPQLLKLKQTAHLSNDSQFAGIWKEIMDLEPVVTTFQLQCAAESCFLAGNQGDWGGPKSLNLAKAAEFCEKKLEIIIASGKYPTPDDFNDAAVAYSSVAMRWPSKNNFLAKSLEYYEKKIKAMMILGQTPTADDLENVACMAFDLGRFHHVDDITRAINYTKSADYHEKKLAAMIASEQEPTAEDYKYAAEALSKAGDYATDFLTKAENYAKSAKYWVEKANFMENSCSESKAEDLYKAAQAYHNAARYLNIDFPIIATKHYSNAIKCYELVLTEKIDEKLAENIKSKIDVIYNRANAEYYEEKLKVIKDSGKKPTVDDLNYAACAFFREGEQSEDPSSKEMNFFKSAKYHEEKLKVIKDSGKEPTPQEFFDAARANFEALEYNLDPAMDANYFAKFKEYIEKACNLRASFIAFGAIGFFKIGEKFKDHSIKAECFAKSAEYYKSRLGYKNELTVQECNNAIMAFHEAIQYNSNSSMEDGYYKYISWYYDYKLEIIKDSGQEPTADDFAKAAEAYDSRFGYEFKVAEYREKQIEAIIKSGLTPTADDLEQAATAHFRTANKTLDRTFETANKVRAAEYREMKIEAIFKSGEEPQAEDFKGVAQYYSSAGLAAQDLEMKSNCFDKFKEYLEKLLESPYATADDFEFAAGECIEIGNIISYPTLKLGLYAEAAKYCEKLIEVLNNLEQTPTAEDFDAAAYTYHLVGNTAGDNALKATSYAKAVEYYQLALTAGIDDKRALQIREELALISGNPADAA